MIEVVQVLVMVALAAVWGGSRLARRMPHVSWLQPFRDAWPADRMTEKQKARASRWSTISSGLYLIMLGMGLPIGYVFLEAMTLSDITRRELWVVGGLSVLCFSLGVIAVVQGATRR